MIIDGKDLILGKLGTIVAKKALEGEEIALLNCEAIVVSGSKADVLAKHKARAKRGNHVKGPFHFKTPERFVKRCLRGMFPYKKERGEKAYKNFKCYRGIPEEFASKKPETIKAISKDQSNAREFTTIAEICKTLGQK